MQAACGTRVAFFFLANVPVRENLDLASVPEIAELIAQDEKIL